MKVYKLQVFYQTVVFSYTPLREYRTSSSGKTALAFFGVLSYKNTEIWDIKFSALTCYESKKQIEAVTSMASINVILKKEDLYLKWWYKAFDLFRHSLVPAPLNGFKNTRG